MKKIIASIFLSILLAAPGIILAQAANPYGTPSGTGTGIVPTADATLAKGLDQNKLITNKPVADILEQVANYVIGILVIMAVFYTLWGAYGFMTSAGNEDKVNDARKRIMYAGIGVIVALLARGIVSLVLSAAS